MSKSLTIADLTDPREVALVATLFELGGSQHAAEAAMLAGYAHTPEEAERAAAILLSSPRISRAIVGEIRARFDAAALVAQRTLEDICASGKSESARISAA